MKIYRVSRYVDYHDGYTYHRSIKDAKKALTQRKKAAKDYGHIYPDWRHIEKIEFDLNKDSIIEAFNKWGGHPDNG